jgi:hypothetical protein
MPYQAESVNPLTYYQMPKVAEQVVPADPLDRSNFGSKEQRTAFPI